MGQGAVDHVRSLEDGAFIALEPVRRNILVRGAVNHIRPLEDGSFIALEPGKRNL
jgi:hypothetical protein